MHFFFSSPCMGEPESDMLQVLIGVIPPEAWENGVIAQLAQHTVQPVVAYIDGRTRDHAWWCAGSEVYDIH